MKQTSIFSIFLLMVVTLATSCGHDNDIVKRLDLIKRVGDTDPAKAMLMLDSAKIDEQKWTEHTRMKCGLLDIRLHDKAYIPATSDLRIRQIAAYFDRHGNNSERQEAYYYEGSVYRDLQNYPQAIISFQKSMDLCSNGEAFDSVMLRNSFSNLGWLYYKVQDYNHALIMSEKEYTLAKSIGILDASTVLNLGTRQIRWNKEEDSRRTFCEALVLMLKEMNESPNPKDQLNTACNLLYHFSNLKMWKQAQYCYRLISSQTTKDSLTSDNLLALGEYYKFVGKQDSAVSCYNTILERNDNMENVYDASKLLFKIYNKLGDTKSTCYYANVFVRASDTLNLGKRQLLAATANNLYQYHRDVKREKDITERGKKYKNIALWSLSILVPLIIIVSILYLYRRHKAVMKILSQQQTLRSYNKEINRLKEEISKQEENLQTHKSSLADTLAKLQAVTGETEHYKAKLKEQQKLLEEKIDQNRDLMRLMHKAEIEGSAEDIVNAVRQSSKGKAKMTDREWDMLIQAVDDLYPDFSNELTNRLGRIDISELRVCYLMLIGLTNPQICNVTDIPHSTVWRWSKRYEWILTWRSNQKKA